MRTRNVTFAICAAIWYLSAPAIASAQETSPAPHASISPSFATSPPASPAPPIAPAGAVAPTTGGAPWSRDAVMELDGALDALLAHAPALRGAHVGVYVVDTATGMQLYAHGADDEVQPASTLKLIVGSAALDDLTPSFRFRTTLVLDQVANASADTLPDVVMRASGDPTLTSADLAAAAAALPITTRVRYVYVDDSAFDRTPYPAGWTWDDFGQAYAPVLSAATLDENVVHVAVTAGAHVGDAALATVAPGDTFLQGRGCVPGAGARNALMSRVTTGARGSDDTVDVVPTVGGCTTLGGSIPFGSQPDRFEVAVPDPIDALAAALRSAIAVRVGATVPEAPTPFVEDLQMRLTLPIPFWTHDSASLGELLGPRFWIPSDNLFGENLLKTLGRANGPDPGTSEGGIAAEKTWLQSIGVDSATVTLADGCGMSQYDRVTARDLVTILQHDWKGPYRDVVLRSLPIGGVRGSIEGIAGTPAEGRVFAKTGSMMHVRGLAGYLATLHHGPVTFAFEVDDWNGDYAALAALRAKVLARIING